MLPLGPCLSALQDCREGERQKEKGAGQTKKLPAWGPHHHRPFFAARLFSASPDQTTTRLKFCSVSTLLGFQMFINTCCNVISCWENTHQVTDADKSVKQMSPPCPSLPPSPSWHTQEAGEVPFAMPPLQAWQWRPSSGDQHCGAQQCAVTVQGA